MTKWKTCLNIPGIKASIIKNKNTCKQNQTYCIHILTVTWPLKLHPLLSSFNAETDETESCKGKIKDAMAREFTEKCSLVLTTAATTTTTTTTTPPPPQTIDGCIFPRLFKPIQSALGLEAVKPAAKGN